MAYKDSQFYSCPHVFCPKNVLLPANNGRIQQNMQVFYALPTVRKAIDAARLAKKTIGLVPTMGALHQGHISLVEASVRENDLTVATIFVNPIQFNNPADLAGYPASLEADLALLKSAGCDLVFVPEAAEMYPAPPRINISFGALEDTMEGVYRPGHFNGVALVVLKLFHLLQPTRAYFGQKDLQQYNIIAQMVFDTSLDIQLRRMPIVREPSGLAMSSRNKRLSDAGKLLAAEIYQALRIGAQKLTKGASAEDALAMAREHLQKFPAITPEYLTWVNPANLQPVGKGNKPDQLALCFAGYIEGVRLIDNIIVTIQTDAD